MTQSKFKADDRIDWSAKPGPDWSLDPDAAPKTEKFEAEVDLSLVTYRRPVDVIEPGALVDGSQECLRIAGDPGDGVVILGNPKLRLSDRLAIGEAHFWTPSGLRSLRLVVLTPRNVGASWDTGTPHPVPDPGEWADKLDRLQDAKHQSRPILGSDLFSVLEDLLSGRWTFEDLDVLLCADDAVMAVRAGGVNYLRTIVDDLDAKTSNRYHVTCAPLVGLDPEDVMGPRGAEALRDAIRARLDDLRPSEVIQTIRTLLPDAVLL